ncbi:MAG: NAD(P)/FAD-dependent oxidoreductase [Ekhidna sp.]
MNIVIIGGGLAGLINAILLSRQGLSVRLYEEKRYPFHRVCGEYISNEVIPFLKKHALYPEDLLPVPISRFTLTAPSGKHLKMPLDLGGFGISRYAFDGWLFQKAVEAGVEVIFDRVVSCEFNDDTFTIQARETPPFLATLAIGAFGKRSTLDKKLSRRFFSQRSPYVGVKYHIQTNEVPDDAIELHNFKDGYCGVSSVGANTFNLCYLSHRGNLRQNDSIDEMERNVLAKNPHLKRIFLNSTVLFDKPEVINEISFEVKEPVYNHILMSGDAAGMITPLCGNGMAMAIHSAALLSNLIIASIRSGFNREQLEKAYASQWNKHFSRRLWAGRNIQRLFGSETVSEIAVRLVKSSNPLAKYLMRQTHGQPF